MEAALHDDIVRVQSDRTGNIRVVLRTDSGETEAFVSPLDTVADAVNGILCTGLCTAHIGFAYLTGVLSICSVEICRPAQQVPVCVGYPHPHNLL